MSRPGLYLVQIREAISRIQKYTALGREDFLNNEMAQDAVLRNLQTLAESSKRLPDDLKSAHPDIDWKGIAGFRNILVHDYLGVELKAVWEITSGHLKPLQAAVESMLQTLDQE